MTRPEQAPLVEVYCRPGCPCCARVRRQLHRRAVPTVWHNIWVDDSAQAFVRSVNAGDETVPTVRIAEHTLTNPSWRESGLRPTGARPDQARRAVTDATAAPAPGRTALRASDGV